MNDAVLEFLGLESNPFHPATVSRSEDVLRTDQHVRLVKRIVSACIEARLSLIIGEHGSGKTTAADSAQLALANQEVDMLRFPVVGVYNAATITKNIIKTLFEFYEINESIKRPFGQQKKIEKIITAIRDSKRRLAILIDDGHAMNSATFLAIKRIYDFFKFGHEHLVGFVILTQPSVKSKLVQLDMEEFTGHCERIEVAGLLSAEEIDAYISRKFRKVVADSAITVSVENWFQLTKLESGLCHPDHNVASTIFACYARPVSGLREKSAQVSPRRLGEICVKALERAATKGRRVVTPEIINHIYQFPVWPVD